MTRFSGDPDGHALTPGPDRAARQQRLSDHVRVLSVDIGERHDGRPVALEAAASYIERTWRAQQHAVQRLCYRAGHVEVCNLELVVNGREPSLAHLVVAAHYDSARGTPGADDNATGVAALLEIARSMGPGTPQRSVRLAALVNEEPPWFRGPDMGARHYVQHLQDAGVEVDLMLSLEMLGTFDDAPGSQQYASPWFGLLYPEVGNYLAFVGQTFERGDVERAIAVFRSHAQLPSEGIAAPRWIPGIDFSDHLAFWDVGWPAVMVTDTAFMRNPRYHRADDLPETLDLGRMTLAVEALTATVRELAGFDEDAADR